MHVECITHMHLTTLLPPEAGPIVRQRPARRELHGFRCALVAYVMRQRLRTQLAAAGRHEGSLSDGAAAIIHGTVCKCKCKCK